MENKLVVFSLLLGLVFTLGAAQAQIGENNDSSNISEGHEGEVRWISVNENETAFFDLEESMPFSGNFTRINGTCHLNLTDLDPMSLNQFKNISKAEFNFTDPTGMIKYGVILKNLVHVSELISFSCNNVTPSTNKCTEPTTYAYGTVWGIGELYVNDTLVNANRVIQVIASERVSSDDKERYELIFDKESPRKDIETRLLIPDMVVTENGTIEKQPVPTTYTLPDGQNQSLIGVIFVNCKLEGHKIMG
jgi:hypothetical protein